MLHTKFIIQAKAELDEEIRVVGNLPDLGKWCPQNALRCLQYDDDEWESERTISVPADQKFEFKLIKCKKNQGTGAHSWTVWEELPKNSNRKYKPQFHSRLFLVWSDPKGRIQKEKSSLKISKNMPGIIFGSMDFKQQIQNHHHKPSIEKKIFNKTVPFKKSFNPNIEAGNDTDSEEQNNNNSFGSLVLRKKSRDIRLSITKEEFESIFLQWKIKKSKLEQNKTEGINNFLKVCFVCSQLAFYSKFIQQTFNEIMKLPKKYQLCLKFLILGEEIQEVKLNKNEQKQIVKLNKLPKNSEMVFLNFDAFLAYLKLIQGRNPSNKKNFRCLYVQKQEFGRIKQTFEGSQPNFEIVSDHIELMCFNDPHTNLELYKYFKKLHLFQEKPENYDTEYKSVKEIDMKIRKEIKLGLQDIIEEIETIVTAEKWHMNFEELDDDDELESDIHSNFSEESHKIMPDFYIYPENLEENNNQMVKQSFTKGQIRELTSTRNSMLIVDSHLFDTDPDFFYGIMPNEDEKSGRMAIIVAEHLKDSENCNGHHEMVRKYTNRGDVCIIMKNFQKLLLSGTLYEPLNQYFEIIKILKYKASFYQKQYSGKIQFYPHSIKYSLGEGHPNSSELINKMREQTKLYIESTQFSNNGSFDIKMHENNGLEIIWHFDKQIRMIKSLFKLKEIEDGDFDCETYLISTEPHHHKLQAIGDTLKKQGIKRLCMLRYMNNNK